MTQKSMGIFKGKAKKGMTKPPKPRKPPKGGKKKGKAR